MSEDIETIFDWQILESFPTLYVTVHFLLVCLTPFVDTFFNTSYFQLKRIQYVSTCFMYIETKFQLDSTKDLKFPYRPPFKNRPFLQRHDYRYDVAKEGDFYNGGLWRKNFMFLWDPTDISFLTT